MKSILKILYNTLADKKVSVIIVLLAITARAIQLFFYLDSFFDTSFQVIATQNFAGGHGISTAIANPADLSETIYQPLINWPPGYSLLLYPFYIASGQNYLIACFIPDLLSAIGIIIITRKILRLLDVSLPVINLFTLLTGFFIYYFYYTGSADGISIAFFLMAVYYTMLALKSDKKWVSRSVLSGVFLLLSASLKYLLFPVVFTLPVFLLIYGFHNPPTGAKKASLIITGIIAAGIAALYFYQKSISGTGAYISSPGRGFFPEHLLRAHPFIPCSFVTPNTLRKLPGSVNRNLMTIFRVIHPLIFAALLVFAIKVFLRSGFRGASLQKTFLFLALSLSAAISIVLSVLSLAVDKELIPPDRWWTYIEDARYYGLADIMAHLSAFLLFYHYRQKVSGFLRYMLLALPILLIPEALRGLSFTAKRVMNAGKEKYYWQQETGFQDYAAAIIQQKKDSLKTDKTIVSGSLYYANYRTSLHQQIPVLEDLTLLSRPAALQSKEPVLLLVIIREDAREGFRTFIDYPETELAGKYNRFYFYTLYVAPH